MNLEERRAWMRSGCPVVVPEPPPVPCREFKLAVDREGKRLVVACQGCDTAWYFPGLRRGSGSDRIDLTLVTGPVDEARQFICGHAVEGGVDREAAEKLYKAKERERVWHWAAAEIDGDEAVFAGGVLGLPGDGLRMYHDAPEWLEQLKEREQAALKPEPVAKRDPNILVPGEL